MSGHRPFDVLRARLTERKMWMAYIRETVSVDTAEEAMILGKPRWSRDLYPSWVIAEVIYKPEVAL